MSAARLTRVAAATIGVLIGAAVACGCEDIQPVALAEGEWRIDEDPAPTSSIPLFETDGVDWEAVEVHVGDDMLTLEYYNPANDSTWRIEYSVPTTPLESGCSAPE